MELYSSRISYLCILFGIGLSTIYKRLSTRQQHHIMIKGLFYILLFYYIGELLSLLIHQFIPGSVIGMILLFLALFFKVLDPANVRKTATVIVKNMAIFFVPAAVGLMVYAELFSKSISIIITAIGVSTVLTIITVAVTQEYFEKRREGKNGTDGK